MIDEKEKLLQTSLYLSVEDVKLKKEIEIAMNGGKLYNRDIYKIGLDSLKEKYLLSGKTSDN